MNLCKSLCHGLLWLVTLTPSQLVLAANGPQFASHGMVVSQNALASEAGAHVLREGGNAIDAAVATAFALAVTHPTAGNIGGVVFLIHRPSKFDVQTYDFR